MSLSINRIKYANLYGPTVGDKVRLADTELFIEIEKDHTVYGDEVKFGGGKTIRDGMGQSATATRGEGVLDFVITGVIIIDHWGIVKADIGIRDGKITGIGKAGNPDTMDGVDEGMIIGRKDPNGLKIAAHDLLRAFFRENFSANHERRGDAALA